MGDILVREIVFIIVAIFLNWKNCHAYRVTMTPLKLQENVNNWVATTMGASIAS